MFRSYKFRLIPNKKQHQELKSILDEQRMLYNAALQERISIYRPIANAKKEVEWGKYKDKKGKEKEKYLYRHLADIKSKTSKTYFDQCKSIKEIDLSGPVNMKRWTLKRLDDAYKAFFKRGEGFPRYKSMNRWKSFGFKEFSGIVLKNNKLKFKGLSGSLRFYKHRNLPTDINLSERIHFCNECGLVIDRDFPFTVTKVQI